MAEKIETGRYPSFSSIDDLLAFTLIVPTLAHEQTTVEFCERSFNVQNIRRRGSTKKSPETYRFDTTRVYCKLYKPDGFDVGTDYSIFDVLFEIQIRTAFEHVWIVATHQLIYKGQEIDWKLVRLGSQIKANVEPCLSGFHPRPLHVGCAQLPE